MNSAYNQYEQEFSRKTNTIRQKITSLQKLNGEKRKVAIQDVERLIEDAKQILKNMEEFANNNKERSLQSKNRTYSRELTTLQRDLQTSSLDTFSRRDDYGYGDDLESQKMDQRVRLLVGNEKLEETNDRLLNTQQIATETEEIGVNILGELSSQRQQLERTRDNLNLINDNIIKGRKILSSMSRRIVTNKIILLFIIIVLIAAIGAIIYFRWIAPLIKK